MSTRTPVTTVIGSNRHVVGTRIPGISQEAAALDDRSGRSIRRRVPRHRLRQAILVVVKLMGLTLIRKAFTRCSAGPSRTTWRSATIRVR